VDDGEAVDSHVARIYQLLVAAYGVPPWEADGDALGGLIATVLSQHTSDINSGRAYAQLIARFPTWAAVRDAPTEAVADAIRLGGLAQVKAERIQRILRELTARRDAQRELIPTDQPTADADCHAQAGAAASDGPTPPVTLAGAPNSAQADGATTSATDDDLSLTALDDLSLEAAQDYLRTLPGVGPKTAACVLLFSLGRPAFPVDTHVWRVTRRLGLIGARVSADAAHAALLALIPPEWRHTMHVNLITHGRRVCHAQRPACLICPLRAECHYYWANVAQEAGSNV